MPLYPLGISRSREVPNVPQQAAGSVNMRWFLDGELACAYIDAPHDAIQPMLHATALNAIHRRICVLPMRFGIALQNESEISDLLQNRREELLDHISRLDRACEMGLRISPPNPPKTANGGHLQTQSPLAYIERRRMHYQQTDANVERENSISQQFVERLQGCYRQWHKLPSSSSHPIRLAFLVERDCVTAFMNHVENVRKELEERCIVLGPWPPYSFV
jgi:hypothetical protein